MKNKDEKIKDTIRKIKLIVNLLGSYFFSFGYAFERTSNTYSEFDFATMTVFNCSSIKLLRLVLTPIN